LCCIPNNQQPACLHILKAESAARPTPAANTQVSSSGFGCLAADPAMQKGHGIHMKIIVFRSPGFLAPLLRRFFRIKKAKKR
jgi:hypothetical protein